MSLIFNKTPKSGYLIKSFTRNVWYDVDIENRTCSCPAFQQHSEKACKHMYAMGVYPIKLYSHKTHPTFSQALSGLVKSLRIRRPEEAVYWIWYMNTLPEQPNRFRMARRLLQGTAEDGFAIPVMEKCAQNFGYLTKKSTGLLYLVAEVVRICKLPNWWHPDSGGPDYIYSCMLGDRQLMYENKKEYTVSQVMKRIEEAIEAGDKAKAISGITAFGMVKGEYPTAKQAELISGLALQKKHELAQRLCEVHLSQRGALSVDNNFISQAVWHMAGGISPVAEKIEPVFGWECKELLDKTEEAWKTPHVIPGWCCDGIHCAGSDVRFAGMMPQMYACCKAFEKYGRLDPSDEWLPEFMVYDGLQIEKLS